MKAPYIWIIIVLLAIIIAMVIFWPEPQPDTTQVYKDQIQKDRLIKQELEAKLNETLARIRTDSLQQAKERQAYQEDVEKLEAVAAKLRANPRVIYVRQTEPAVDSLISYQDSVISRQKERIDILEVNLADLRLDTRKITANFEAQIQALGSIREAQMQIISQQEKEIKKHKREKRIAIVGGIAGVLVVLILK